MSIVTGPIWQIGCVVEDLDRAEHEYTRGFGVPEWTRFPAVEFAPGSASTTGQYRGEPADYAIEVALGYAGAQQVELIRPTRGVNLYTEFLERCGPGVHHLAWVPEDFEAALEEAARQGHRPAQSGSNADMEFAYLETPDMGVHVVELLRFSPRLSRVFDRLRARAVSGPRRGE